MTRDRVDLRLRPGPRVAVVFAGVTAFETAFVTEVKVLDMAVMGLVGGDSRGDVDALEGVARVERVVGEVGSGKLRGWCRVETMVTEELLDRLYTQD